MNIYKKLIAFTLVSLGIILHMKLLSQDISISVVEPALDIQGNLLIWIMVTVVLVWGVFRFQFNR